VTERLHSLIQHGEVLTSSALLARASRGGGVKEATLRQRLARAASAGRIWRSRALVLPRNERLVALEQPVADGPTLDRIAVILETVRPRMARVVRALQTTLALPLSHVCRLSGTLPSEQAQESVARVCHALEEIKGLRRLAAGTPLDSVVRTLEFTDSDAIEAAMAGARQLVVGELLLARIVCEALRYQNVVAWNGLEYAEPGTGLVTFNGQPFSAFGFSYLAPLSVWREGRRVPCPVVVDIWPQGCREEHVASLMDRLQLAMHRGERRQQSLPIISAPSISRQAWSSARSQGLWLINLRQAVGNVALEALASVERLLLELGSGGEQGADSAAESLAHSLRTLQSNPVFSTVRGIALEMLAGLILRADGAERVVMGKLVPYQQTKRDIDAVGYLGGQPVLVECKAVSRGMAANPEDITRFFSQTVPAFIKWSRQRDEPVDSLRAEFWTTGEIDADCRAALGRVRLASVVRAELLDYGAILRRIPAPLARCKELLPLIAVRLGDEDRSTLLQSLPSTAAST
jgi:hypothetical protein